MSRKNKAVQSGKTPAFAVIIIAIMVVVIMANGMTILYKYIVGFDGLYRTNEYDMYAVVQERFGELGETYQRQRRNGMNIEPQITGSMAVGEYYYYAIIRDALEAAGNVEGVAYYRSVTDNARDNAGQFADSTSTIDQLIQDAIK